MPIINYKDAEVRKKKELFANENISKVNKGYLKKFLEVYNESDATLSIFYEKIQPTLESLPDIKKAMNDRDLINKTFHNMKNRYKPTHLGMITAKAVRFVTWLNDGDKPIGFKDIKNVSKLRSKRDLKPSDMITWDDGKEMALLTTSIQLKAIILTQLDAGLRPSEFIDLDYGDVEVKKDLVVLNVRGKTGARPVICHRSAPAFLRWFNNHLTKKKTHPLWIMENAEKSHTKVKNKFTIKRYDYYAIRKRIARLGEKAEIKKPLDFYNFRHSSCVLDKKDNLPSELAADRHGHSVEFFTKTYGRLDTTGIADRFRKHYGKEEQKNKPIENIVCEACSFVNEPDAQDCEQCTRPLSLKHALSIEQELKKTILEETKKMIEAQLQQ